MNNSITNFNYKQLKLKSSAEVEDILSKSTIKNVKKDVRVYIKGTFITCLTFPEEKRSARLCFFCVFI